MGFKKPNLSRIIMMSAFAFGAISMNGCDALYLNEASSLESVRQKSEIVVLTTPGPLIYSTTKHGEIYGIDHDLIEDFAGTYNFKVKYKFFKSEKEALAALENGQGDFVAARTNPGHSQGFLVGPAFQDTTLGLFCQSDLNIENIQDLNNKKIVLLERDNFLGYDQKIIQYAPFMNLDILPKGKAADVIRLVNDNKVDCAITEQAVGRLALRYNPKVEFSFEVSEKYPISWVLAKDNNDLLVLMQAWFQQAARNDDIMRVMDRYQSMLTGLSKNDIRFLRKNMMDVLPEYQASFVDAGQEHRLPWQLIAAVAYQESKWNPDAQSFTGVRGIMQLTQETAEHLGISDREDPIQSIWGGSKYLRYLINKFPKSINSKDRIALGLAAYNIGFAHLRDAQKLAIKMGHNPYSWKHLREILPLLEQEKHAQHLEYGTARGTETVEFVERVKSYYNFLLSYY